MPPLVHAMTARKKKNPNLIDADEVYVKCLRMIKGCTSREQLRTTYNFIDLLSSCFPKGITEQKLKSIKEEYHLQEAKLFGVTPKKKTNKKYLNSKKKSGILGMNPFRRNKEK